MGPVAPQPQARPRIPVNLPPSAASSATLGPNTAAFRLLIVLNLEQHNDPAITSILLTVRHLDHWGINRRIASETSQRARCRGGLRDRGRRRRRTDATRAVTTRPATTCGSRAQSVGVLTGLGGGAGQPAERIRNCVLHPERTSPTDDFVPTPVICGRTQFSREKYVSPPATPRDAAS